MRILLGGGSGMIGRELTNRLRESGHDVVRLTRRPAREPRSNQRQSASAAHGTVTEWQWDPAKAELDPSALDGCDAVVNLSGASVGSRPWTRGWVEQLYSSRITATRTLVGAMKAAGSDATLVSQSAVGYYGDRGDEVLTETSSAGTTVLADICKRWEHEALQAPDACRVVLRRTGIVCSPTGGALSRLLVPLRLGIGGPLGSGEQWWPWISLRDEVSAILFLLESELEGPVNSCAPQPARLREVISALASELGKPSSFAVPEAVLTAALGRMAREVLLTSDRVEPTVLTEAGFTWEQPDLASLAHWTADQIGKKTPRGH